MLKSTIFPEWYQERIQPWVQYATSPLPSHEDAAHLSPLPSYVPIAVDYRDLWSVMGFFKGDDEGRGSHEHLAEKMATQGKEWSGEYWRFVDMQACKSPAPSSLSACVRLISLRPQTSSDNYSRCAPLVGQTFICASLTSLPPVQSRNEQGSRQPHQHGLRRAFLNPSLERSPRRELQLQSNIKFPVPSITISVERIHHHHLLIHSPVVMSKTCFPPVANLGLGLRRFGFREGEVGWWGPSEGG